MEDRPTADECPGPLHPRRAVLRALAGALSSRLLVAAPIGAQNLVPTPSGAAGDCGGNLGVQMLREWSFNGLPVPPQQALPGPNWKIFVDPANPAGAFFYPPDWTATPFVVAGWAGVRVASADGQAAMQSASRFVPAADAQQIARFGLQALLGAAPSSTLCANAAQSPLAAVAFVAVRSGGLIAVSQGFVSPPAGLGVFALYRAAAGPAAQFTALTRQVFLPVLYSLPHGGGGGAAPTPTPPPEGA